MSGVATSGGVVVVGASIAGIAAVEELRRRGFDGPITMVGEEAGPPYDRPPLTKAVLAGGDPADCALRSAEWPEELEVEMRSGTRAVRLDLGARELELDQGERLGFDDLILATGSVPRRLPGPPLDGVFTVRTLDDALALRQALVPEARLVVVGGGFIGAEVAATARRAGLTVTIVEGEATPLARSLGPEIGALIAQIHTDEGVEVRCGLRVAGLEGEGRVERVRLADGTAIEADAVVVGLGVRPCTDWLESSGLTLGDGIVCDSFCRASAARVFAAGDVARWDHPRLGQVRIEHWENAVAQGRFAAGALLGLEDEPYAPVPYVWSDQYEHKLQIVGRPGPDDDLVVVEGSFEERRFLAAYVAGTRVTAAVTLNRRASAMRARGMLREGIDLPGLLAGFEGAKKRGGVIA
jgi:3-phenylpropionate/trans-cinnamate dioxygenase ferredoxin reductase subunit